MQERVLPRGWIERGSNERPCDVDAPNTNPWCRSVRLRESNVDRRRPARSLARLIPTGADQAESDQQGAQPQTCKSMLRVTQGFGPRCLVHIPLEWGKMDLASNIFNKVVD
jgi:hypothetical protein